MSELIIPLFYDDSSGKSILTWMDEKEIIDNGPSSILKIAKQNSLKEIYFVSKNFHTFNAALKACEKNEIQLKFGLELWITDDSTVQDEQSSLNESKVIVWMKNKNGYKDLIKLYSIIHTSLANKYYHFRGSWDILQRCWTENLVLTIPFWDSFLHKNLLVYGAKIIPKFPVDPIFFFEKDSGIIYEPVLLDAIQKYNNKYETVRTKTIYYETFVDSKAWLTYKCILNRSTFSKPEMEFCSSDRFCFEHWLNLIK